MAGMHNFFENKRKFDGLSGEGGSSELELSLGLSLNGQFGYDPNKGPLFRSSSVENFSFGNMAEVPPVAEVVLGRTWSMPVATETEEWRKRKEEQSVRRMEAKRKRVEKMASREMEGENGRMKERQVSIGPQRSGGGSSGVSESGQQHANQLANPPVIVPRPSPPPLPKQNKQNQRRPIGGAKTGLPPAKPANPGQKEVKKNTMLDMPFVFTKDVGPNGRRIEGFLYQYRRGEELKIVCVCHGSFLTPAEFVRHAGGGDVAYPLKHIVVNSSPLM